MSGRSGRWTIAGGTRKKNRGAALLLALFVVGMVSALSVRMTGDYLTNIRYQRNYLYGEQAYFYLLSAEALAMHTLLEDLLEDRSNTRWHDSHCETWANDRVRLPIPGGAISVRIRDLQSRFNINGMRLHVRGIDHLSATVPYSIHHRRFVRLLQVVSPGLSEEDAIGITQRMVDWLDEDSETQGTNGLEDDGYASLGLPYRTSNGPFNSVTELRFIPGIDRDLYRRLLPHIRAWPHGGSNININTATPAVLRALPDTGGLRPIGADDVEEALYERDAEEQNPVSDPENFAYRYSCGYNNVGEFAGLVPWVGKVRQTGMTTHSTDFIVQSEVQLADVTTRMKSVVRRHRSGHLYVIMRSFHDL